MRLNTQTRRPITHSDRTTPAAPTPTPSTYAPPFAPTFCSPHTRTPTAPVSFTSFLKHTSCI